MSTEARVRIDVWLWRARFHKTRAEAARCAEGGGIRLVRESATCRVDKAARLIGVGDILVFAGPGGLRSVRVAGLGERRGPAAEARTLYADIEAQPNGDIAGLA